MDYAAWASRASAFLRGLTFLPGEIAVHDAIEEPATDDFSQEWLNSSACSLPAELKSYLETASKRSYLSYDWTPPEKFRAPIEAYVKAPGTPVNKRTVE